jgi:hypothetical protein
MTNLWAALNAASKLVNFAALHKSRCERQSGAGVVLAVNTTNR